MSWGDSALATVAKAVKRKRARKTSQLPILRVQKLKLKVPETACEL